MPQTTQIIPRFSFPYVETVINDNTELTDGTSDVVSDPRVTYAFAFTSSKGTDNKFIKKSTYSSGVATFGESNYKKYGQPLMQALDILRESNTDVWCMRVMPENATYANNVIILKYKEDAANVISYTKCNQGDPGALKVVESDPQENEVLKSDVVPYIADIAADEYVTKSETSDASKRRFVIKFAQKAITADEQNPASLDEAETQASVLADKAKAIVENPDAEDENGFKSIPILLVRSDGRGIYGNDFCLKVATNATYEKEYGIKMYAFNALTMDGGLRAIASYVGSLVSSTKYDQSTLIDDILDSVDVGVAPIQVSSFEDNIEVVYNAYKAFCLNQHDALLTEYDEKLESYNTKASSLDINNFKDIVGGTAAIPTDANKEVVAMVKEMQDIKNLIKETEADQIVDLDCFDPICGTTIDETSSLPYIAFESDDNSPSFNSVKGITLSEGNDGYFANPRQEKYIDENGEQQVKQWTYEEEVEHALNCAFDGTFDRRILASRRIPVNAFWDANYPFTVKSTLANLAIHRNDALCYLDCGTDIKTFSTSNINTLVKKYSIFDNRLISKNVQHFKVKERPKQKKVDVSITYFLAIQYAYHVGEYGSYIPFVKSYAQLSNHVKDSLEPSIEDYETDLKETLNNNRFNYFETLDDNTFQRSTQNTSQMKETDLIEENNVTTLYTLKREIERDISDRLYDFADESSRTVFANYEKAKYASWVGTKLQSLDISFTANEWESAHSILHCYLAIVFRGLQKRAIVEIDINKRTYTSTSSDDEE